MGTGKCRHSFRPSRIGEGRDVPTGFLHWDLLPGQLHRGGESIRRGRLKCNLLVPCVTEGNGKKGREETVFKAVGGPNNRELNVNLKGYSRARRTGGKCGCWAAAGGMSEQAKKDGENRQGPGQLWTNLGFS